MAGTNVATLTAKITADTSGLKRGLGSAEREVKGFGSRTASVFKGIGVAAVAGVAVAGAAVAGLAAKSVAEFAKFEQGMNEVFTLLPDISEQAMGEMEGQVKDLAREFGVLPEKVVPALYQALSAGVPKDNVFEFMETATKAAIGGAVDLEVAVDGLTSVVNAYGAENIDAAEASDLMFTAVRLGKTTMDELARSLFQVNPVAAAMGIEFGDITAALAAMTAQGTPTRVATTQLRQALVELGKEGTVAFDAFQKATGQTFPAFIAGGGNVNQAFQAMKDEADRMGVGVGDLFGSVEAGMGVISLTSESGAKAFSANMEEMIASAGATEAAFGTMDQGAARMFDRLKTAVNLAFIDIGEQLAPLIEEMLPDLTAAIEDVGDAMVAFAKFAVPAAIEGFLHLETAVLNFQIALLKAKSGYGEFVDVMDVLMTPFLNFPDVMSRADRAQLAWLTTQREVVRELFNGADATGVAYRALADLGAAGALTADRVAGLQERLGLTNTEMLDAGTRAQQMAIHLGATTAESMLMAGALGHLIPLAAADAVTAFDTFVDVMADRVGPTLGTIPPQLANVGRAVGHVSGVLGDSASDFAKWEQDLGDTAADLVKEMDDATSDIVSLWEGAADDIEITAEDMMANIIETAAQKAEMERVWRDLMNAGLYGLADELTTQGPTATQAMEDFAFGTAVSSSDVFAANFLLDPTAGLAALEGGNATAIAWRVGLTLGETSAAGFDTGFRPNVTLPGLPGGGRPRGEGDGAIPDWLASGGPVSAGSPYVVGEEGPELFVPNTSGSVVPNDQMGGRTVNVYIDRVESDDLPGDIAEGLIRASITEQVDLIGGW